MLEFKKKMKLSLFFIILVNILLLFAVFLLMNHVKNLLNSDVRINLTEIVTQNKDVITSKLKVELNNLDNAASQFADRLFMEPEINQEVLRNTFLTYARQVSDESLTFANAEGLAIFSTGQEIDIAGRRYFRLSIDGIKNISDRLISRLDGTEVFVISVPVYYEKKIIGTMQRHYTPKEMYDICSISLFSSQGYMHIINNEGYILISSRTDEENLGTNNYYRMIYSENPVAATQLEEDIKSNKAGFLETTTKGEKIFSAFTPIEEVYDWYLISSVSHDAVSANANIVIRMFYVILCMLVLIFATLMGYFWYYKHKQQIQLETIAFVDRVTTGHTLNRFVMNLEYTLKSLPNKQFHLVAIDIDNFKYINNFYGFEFGDRILYQINQIIRDKLTSCEMIARTYNDHFVILLEDISENRLSEIFNSVQEIESVKIYVSAGLYTITNIYENTNIMVDKANIAARSVKNLRYKQIGVYSEEFDKQMIHNEQMKRAVEKALANDEIIPFFQPKVNINTRQLVGAEALARWRKADGKLVSPAEFIPVCENTGMIVELDLVIFEKTLQFLQKNIEKGISCVPISVNFSRLHLTNSSFIEQVVEKLQQYNVPASLIELEITETVMFENNAAIQAFIEKLHSFGLVISMDDFGSGYSSLNMLKDIPIDILKIDGEFLNDTAHSRRQKIIFSAISQMAKDLQITLVVEGVETKENVELMKEFKCYIAQGYYYSKPVAEELFEKIFEEGTL